MDKKLAEALSKNMFPIKERTILLGYRGSIAHGTHIPKAEKEGIDDKDVIGICIPPKEYYFGMKKFEQYEKFEGEWDIVIYSLKKYISLLLKNNPNIMPLLWLKKEQYIIRTIYGDRLIENRSIFNSKLAYETFCGYANGQLKRMTSGSYLGYMGEKRKRLVKKYGYDCKNAAHLIRLLKMGIDFLIKGAVIVDRPEKDILIEIKSGLWSIEKVKKAANNLFAEIEKAYKKSKLKDKPDYKKANKLLIEITEEYLSKNG